MVSSPAFKEAFVSRINGEKARASIARKRRTVRRLKEREIREKLLAARAARLAAPPPAPKPVTEARKPVEVKAEPTKLVEVKAEPTKPVEVTPEPEKKKAAAKKPAAAPAASGEKPKETGKKPKPATPPKSKT